jgi:hypothetical protein
VVKERHQLRYHQNLPNLLYAKTHEWIRQKESGGTKVATVGITAFAVEFHHLVFMNFPKSADVTGRSLRTELVCGERPLRPRYRL